MLNEKLEILRTLDEAIEQITSLKFKLEELSQDYTSLKVENVALKEIIRKLKQERKDK